MSSNACRTPFVLHTRGAMPTSPAPRYTGKIAGARLGSQFCRDMRSPSLHTKIRRGERNQASDTEKTGLECKAPQEEWPNLAVSSALSLALSLGAV